MSLTIDQQKQLYDGLCDRIIELHLNKFKNELRKFTNNMRNRGQKGVVLVSYTNITDMIMSVKNNTFFYEWVPKEDALKIKHVGITNAIMMMDPKKDCVVACSLSLSLKHLYVNCFKIKDIAT